MTKQQFDKLEAELKEKGYKKYIQTWHHEDYILGKAFHKYDNQWEENRAAYQIILSVYDYSDKNYPGLTEKDKNHVGIEVRFVVSRTIDERIDMTIAWHDDTTIEEIEDHAEQFYQWCCDTWIEPRNYN